MMVDLIDTIRHLSPRAFPAHRVDRPRCPLHCRRRAEIASLVHRYYDPVTGQFLSVDPLVGVTGTPYVFTEGDPVNESDLSGLSGNATDAACNGGEAPPPGETQAQACAAAEQNAKQVTKFELSNHGSEKPVVDLFPHVVVGFGGCFVLCANVSFQGGAVSFAWGGFGLLDRGPYVGWANEPSECRQGDQAWLGGGYVAGASGSIGINNKDSSHPAVPKDWEVDVGPYNGFGGGELSNTIVFRF
jgi:hypothetical protein